MGVIKNRRTKQKVLNTMQTQGAPVTEDQVDGRLLPEVTSSDNNKILAVVNGAWAMANAPKGFFLINVVGNPSAPSGISATFAEIFAAFRAGMLPVIWNTNTTGVYTLSSLSYTGDTSTDSHAWFDRVNVNATLISRERFTITGNGTFSYTTTTYSPS